MTFHYELLWIVLGFILTVMVLSYLIGDNIFFRFAAHLFIGLTAGYVVLLIANQILWPYLINPLIRGDWMGALWLLIPMILMSMLVLSQFKRFNWIGSMPLAYLAGLAAAIAIGGAVFGTIIPQSTAIIDAFDTTKWLSSSEQTWLQVVDAAVMLIGTIGTLSYFHLGRKRKVNTEAQLTERPLVLEVLAKIGEVFIGITLGVVFTGVFSSTLLALIDRILFIGQFISNLIGSV
jgi:hypothetical protein